MGVENFASSSSATAVTKSGCASACIARSSRACCSGEALSAAYANMDLFVFPSHTDTFGNVVLEALSSGVPAIVTPDGGPKTIVRDGETGRIVPDDQFAAAIAAVLADPAQHAAMRHGRPRLRPHRQLGFGL